MADGLNMTTAELRKLAGEGGITPEKALEGLEKGAANIDRQFGQLTKTIDQGLTNISTGWTKLVGETSQSVFASQRIFKVLDETVAQSLNTFASAPENVKALANVIETTLGGALVLVLARTLSWTAGLVASIGATTRKSLANVRLAETEVAVARANLATSVSNNALLTSTNNLVASSNALAVAEERLAIVKAQLTPYTLALASANGILNKSMVVATYSARALWGAIGGPIGLVAILATLAYSYFSTGESAEESFKKQAKAAEDARVEILKDTRAILEGMQLNPDNLQSASYNKLIESRVQLLKREEKAQLDVVEARNAAEKASIQRKEAEDALAGVTEKGTAGPRGTSGAVNQAKKDAQQRLDQARIAEESAKKVEQSAIRARDSLQKAEENITGALGGSKFASIRGLKDLTKDLADQLERIDDGGDTVQATQKKIKEFEKGVNLADPDAVAAFKEWSKAALDNAKAIEARKKAISDANKAERKSIRESEAEAKRQAKYIASIEKEQATLNVSSTDRRIIERQLAIEEQNLTGATKERAQAIVALLNARDKEQQQAANAKENIQLEVEYLRILGKEREASSIELSSWLEDTKKKLSTEGNSVGVDLAKSLFNKKAMKQQAEEAVKEAEKSLTKSYVDDKAIETKRVSGMLTTAQAADATVQAHKEQADIIERQLIPALEKQAKLGLVGSEEAKKRVADAKLQVAELRAELGYLERALQEGFTEGLNDAVQGLADGTMSLRDATLALINSISSSLLKVATKDLSERMFNAFKDTDFAKSLSGSLSGIFGGGGQAAQQTTQAASGVMELATSATTLGTASTSLTVAGTSLQTAAAALTTAASSLTAGSATSGVAGAAGAGSGLFSWLGFASGGQVSGAGTSTSDSIPAWLSNNEFVVRASSVKEKGALSFLQDFNQNGMSALDRWKHSTGGLAGMPAPSVNVSRSVGLTNLPQEGGKSSSTTLKNSQNFYLIDDPTRISEIVGSKSGTEAIAVAISRNPSKFRSILGV